MSSHDNDEDEEDNVRRGYQVLFSGSPELALPFFKKALKADPRDTAALDGIGEACVEMGRFEEAVKAFRKSCEIAPDELPGTKWMFLGQLLNGKESLECYLRGVALLEGAGSSSSSSSKTKKASSHSSPSRSETRARNGEISNAYVAIAELYLSDLCMEPEAERRCEECVSKALEANPENVQALQTLASIRLSQSRNDEARDIMMRVFARLSAMELSPPPLLTEMTAAASHEEEEEEEEKEVVSPTFDFLVSTAQLLSEVSEFERARSVLEHLVQEDDEIVQVWVLLGFCHDRLKSPAFVVRECYERAAELLRAFSTADPADAYFREELVRVRELIEKLPPVQDEEEEEEEDAAMAGERAEEEQMMMVESGEKSTSEGKTRRKKTNRHKKRR